MSPARVTRLIALVMLPGSALGLWLAAVGWFGQAEGTACFAVTFLVALLTLHANRPQEPRKPRAEARGNRAKG